MSVKEKISDKKVKKELFELYLCSEYDQLEQLCEQNGLTRYQGTAWAGEKKERIKKKVFPSDSDYWFEALPAANHIDSFMAEDTEQDKRDAARSRHLLYQDFIKNPLGYLAVGAASVAIAVGDCFSNSGYVNKTDVSEKHSWKNKVRLFFTDGVAYKQLKSEEAELKREKKEITQEVESDKETYQSDRAKEICYALASFETELGNKSIHHFGTQKSNVSYENQLFRRGIVTLSEEAFEEQLKGSFDYVHLSMVIDACPGSAKYERALDGLVDYFKKELYPKMDNGMSVRVRAVLCERADPGKISVKYLGDEINARVFQYFAEGEE